MVCPKCGKEIENSSSVCPFCQEQLLTEKVLSVNACADSGEMVMTDDVGLLNKAVPKFSKVLGDGFKAIINAFKNVLKNKKAVIISAIMAVVWLAIDIIKATGHDSPILRIFSFITFANGGMNGGLFGFIGGIIGKGVYAGTIVSIVDSISKKKRGLFSGVKGLVKFDKGNIFPYLMGIGLAFIGFIFVSGGKMSLSFMGGLSLSYVCLKASNKVGFLKKLFASIFAKGKDRIPSFVPTIIKGLSVGSLLASLIGLTDVNFIVIIVGFILFILGLIMTIVNNKSKKQGGNE